MGFNQRFSNAAEFKPWDKRSPTVGVAGFYNGSFECQLGGIF